MAHAKILTDTNLRALMAVLKDEREKVMVLLSLKAGLRAVEIAGLTWGCVRQDDTTLELINTKGGKPRSVPIGRDLRDALQAHRAECKHTADDDRLFRARHAKPGNTVDGQRGGRVVPRFVYPPPWLDRLLIALRSPHLRDDGRSQRNDRWGLTARRAKTYSGMPA